MRYVRIAGVHHLIVSDMDALPHLLDAYIACDFADWTMSVEQDSDDDVPRLSDEALAALAAFQAEQAVCGEENIAEDWQVRGWRRRGGILSDSEMESQILFDSFLLQWGFDR